MIKKSLLVIAIALLALALGLSDNAWALSYSGCLATDHSTSCSLGVGGTSDGSLSGTDGWSSGVLFSWTVTLDDKTNLWTYDYWFESSQKFISHIIIEVSDTFTIGLEDITTNVGLVDGDELSIGTFSPGSSNPNLPESFFGIKLNFIDPEDGTFVVHVTLSDVDRNPIWGDFFAKDGVGSSGVVATVFNAGFTSPDSDPDISTFPASNGSVQNHILVPDTEGITEIPVPEPTTALLLGSGLLGLLGFSRRRIFGKP